MIGRQDHVSVFTKLTLLTGVAFVLSYTLKGLIVIDTSFEFGMSLNTVNMLKPPAYVMLYLNQAINPVICFIVCKGVSDDLNHFIRAVTRRIRHCCTCGPTQREVPASNVNYVPRAIAYIELTSRAAGTRSTSNVATTSFNGVRIHAVHHI